jgi:hypothetical protein
VFAVVALAATVICTATADALPPAAYFRSRPAKPEIDSGVFARDAARDLGEADRIVKGEIEVVNVGGLHTGFLFQSVDHLVLKACAAQRCCYGYRATFGTPKTMTWINCCD